MNNTRNTAAFRYVTAVRLLLICALLMLGASPTITAARMSGTYFPNVPLVNQDGETLRFYDDVIKGKVVSINFMFTSCGDACPLETAKLREVQKRLGEHAGKNVFMYSITVDPDRDTPPVLKAYMERFKVGPGWQFLTGKKEDIDLIRKKLAMYTEDGDDLSNHAINFILGNEATGQWMKRTPFDVPESLIAMLLGRLQKHSLVSPETQQSYVQARPLPGARAGEDLYRTRCAACHTIGQGDNMGPDLLGVVSKRERAWLVRWLQEPDVMLKEKDPLATALYVKYNNVPMPNLRLTRQDALDLIQYIQEGTRQANARALGILAPAAPPENREKPGPAVGTTPPANNSAANDQAQADAASVNEVQ